MCLDSVACVRRQPGGGTTLFQGFVTMPISEERTSDKPCYLFAQHVHSMTSLSALLRWLYIFLPLQCGQRKSRPEEPCSSPCLPPHPTCNNTLKSPKGKMMVQEALQNIRSSLGKGGKKQRKQSRYFLSCGN